MSTEYVFFEGEFVPWDQANFHISTHAFLYGTAIFEGVRAYWNDNQEQLYVFRLREHSERLLNNSKYLYMDLPYSADQIDNTIVELLRRNQYRADVYIRPIAYKADTRRVSLSLVDTKDEFLVWALEFGAYVDIHRPLSVMVSSWQKTPDAAIPARVKLNGVYANSSVITTEAVMNGCDEGLVMNHAGKIAEGSGENLFLIRDGVLVTPSVTSDILEGITRNVIIELATDQLGLPVQERTVDRSELYVADEMFFSGTGAQVSPIGEVDRRKVGNGEIGPLTKKIQDLFFEIVRGNNEKYRRWCTPVY